MNLEGLTTSLLQCNLSDKWCGPLQRTYKCKSASPWAGYLICPCPNFPVCGMGNRDIFPFIGNVLTGEKVRVGYLDCRLPLSFYYVYLPNVLEITVDFWILM